MKLMLSQLLFVRNVLGLSACPNLPAGSLQLLLLADKPTELSRSVFITPQLQSIQDFS